MLMLVRNAGLFLNCQQTDRVGRRLAVHAVDNLLRCPSRGKLWGCAGVAKGPLTGCCACTACHRVS